LQLSLRPAKKWLRTPYRSVRARYIRWRYSFGPSELLKALRDLGIQPGDAILVHSAVSGFEGFRGELPDVIATLQEAVGVNGTLLMPTLSMSGSAIEFAQSGKIFNLRTTPSQVGLLTEVFRRSPDVMRSVHPTHSVAVRGPETGWWIANHHLAGTPCGLGSPFHCLLERRGKILLAGVGISAMTFYHCIEEILESRMPESPFTAERYVMKCKVGDETVETAPMRLYAPAVSRRRQLEPLKAELLRAGKWHEGRIGTLLMIALDSAEVLEAARRMADRGQFCYTHP